MIPLWCLFVKLLKGEELFPTFLLQPFLHLFGQLVDPDIKVRKECSFMERFVGGELVPPSIVHESESSILYFLKMADAVLLIV